MWQTVEIVGAVLSIIAYVFLSRKKKVAFLWFFAGNTLLLILDVAKHLPFQAFVFVVFNIFNVYNYFAWGREEKKRRI